MSEFLAGNALLSLELIHGVAHPHEENGNLALVNVPKRSTPLAGFQVSPIGRFWVSPEVDAPRFETSIE